MSLTRKQQILLKRTQAEARLSDADYREAIATISGMPDCRSSTDVRLSDGHWDGLLSYFEAIHWQRVDAAELQPACKPGAIFRKRGHWASKNRRGDTSRDRYVGSEQVMVVQVADERLAALGYGLAYLQAIQNRIRPFSIPAYRAALERTLKSKQPQYDCPF